MVPHPRRQHSSYCSTGERTAELNIHLEGPVSSRTVQRELHKINIHCTAATAKPLITESNAQMRKRWCHDHKTWTSDSKATGRMIWSDESSFTLFPTPGRVYVWRTPMEAYNSECLVPTVKHGGGSVMVWAAISWYSILLVPLLPFVAELLYVDTLGNQVLHPMIQTLFPNDALFQSDTVPLHTAGTVPSWFEGELQHLPWPAQLPDFNITEPLWSVLVTGMRNRFPSPTSLKEAELYKIPLQTVRNLYESIPRRNVAAAVLKAKGGPTPY
jgi:hypothetical protein